MAATDELRPTPDRVRETLFNWLAPFIADANCLDCYAGCGALGFEALSRGAASCVFIEQNRNLQQRLRSTADKFEADGAEIFWGNAPDWLDRNQRCFDIVFVDPPFATDLAARTCIHLLNGRHLAPAGLVYVETAPGWVPPADGFDIRRQGKAGHVQYMLLQARPGDQP